VCGDDIVNPDPPPGPAEECDDGNTVADDGCDASCDTECGNGTINGSEECDTSGESATCDDDCTNVACGDDNVNEAAGETCDDGNTVDGDGCSFPECQGECVAQTKPQQACINGVNKNVLGVLKAEDKGLGKCIKDVAAGKQTDYAACVAAIDTSKAEGKTTNTITKKCTDEGVPSFAFTDAATVNAAAKDNADDALALVLGDPATIASKSADKEGAACQAEVARRHFKLQETWLSEANKAKKAALKAGVGSATDLAAGIDTAVAGSAKITKAENGVNSGIAKKCPDTIVDADFDCDGATTSNGLALCVIASAKRGACLALEGADDLALDCPGD
jgi:cysteine-rich repeat protein